jgi:hypothetical protein
LNEHWDFARWSRLRVAPGQSVGIMMRDGLVILAFEADDIHFHHTAAIATLRVPGLPAPLTAISVHLCPNGTPVRLREVSYLFGHAGPEGYAIIGGDFNSLAPGDPEPADLDDLAPHLRARYIRLAALTSRRRAMVRASSRLR